MRGYELGRILDPILLGIRKQHPICAPLNFVYNPDILNPPVPPLSTQVMRIDANPT